MQPSRRRHSRQCLISCFQWIGMFNEFRKFEIRFFQSSSVCGIPCSFLRKPSAWKVLLSHCAWHAVTWCVRHFPPTGDCCVQWFNAAVFLFADPNSSHSHYQAGSVKNRRTLRHLGSSWLDHKLADGRGCNNETFTHLWWPPMRSVIVMTCGQSAVW